MLFNSIDFAIFLPAVFILYWFVLGKNLQLQNLLIVVSSYLFYGWWDWRYLILIFISTLIDFLVGIGLSNQTNLRKRKMLLWISIISNIGLLCFFKYYNFFLENFVSTFLFFGKEIKSNSLNFILPVGISFYTFQTLGYSIDIYKKKLEPTKNFLTFSAFVSFFPQLVAGPIERATHLLPQFYQKKVFDYSKAVDGMRQILWGLFKKIVFADNCAEYANLIFNNSADYTGVTLFLGAIFFTFQIYGDFSGYSDIAIGTSRLFSFELMQNFKFPYFSRDIAEFWRRWHISLSTWFRDYVYIPLGGSRGGTFQKIRNTFIIFVVSGFWHGANWTFIVWGILHAIYFLPLLLTNKNRNHIEIVSKGNLIPTFNETLKIVLTFTLTVFAWIFFRANNIEHALNFIYNLIIGMNTKIGYLQLVNLMQYKIGYATLILLLLFIIIEWIGREGQYAIYNLGIKWSRSFRYALYYAIIIVIFWNSGEEQQFIYFQF